MPAGMMFVEFDLSGAEWVVVAYLTEDPAMLAVAESGRSPHVVTGALISGAPEEFVEAEHKVVGARTDPTEIARLRQELAKDIRPQWFLPRTMSIRQAGKRSNHGLNYGMKYRRFALENEMLENDALPIVEAYTTVAYPGVPIWWGSIRAELRQNKRCLENCFGRKVRLLGEWGDQLFNAAYSFKPQSTVVDVCNKGMINCYNDETLDLQLGAQVHDSLLLLLPVPNTRVGWIKLALDVYKIAKEHMSTPIIYNNRRFILGVDAKLGINWGNMQGFALHPDPALRAEAMSSAYAAATEGKSASPQGLEAEVVEAAEDATAQVAH